MEDECLDTVPTAHTGSNSPLDTEYFTSTSSANTHDFRITSDSANSFLGPIEHNTVLGPTSHIL